MGCDRVPGKGYLDSGVLPLDLVKTQPTLPRLEAVRYEMIGTHSAFTLEVTERSQISLTWNAHEIGLLI